MFVDNLRDPVPGQWSVRLTDVTSGHRRPAIEVQSFVLLLVGPLPKLGGRIGERGFIVYDARDVGALGAGMPKHLKLSSSRVKRSQLLLCSSEAQNNSSNRSNLVIAVALPAVFHYVSFLLA